MGEHARCLSYHDVLLRNSDVDLLNGPHWLNDQLIAFYFTYLLEEVYPSLGSHVSLIPAGASFLLLNSDPSEAVIIFEALKLHEKELIIFAVNDNPDVQQAAGGSHWSCLAYHRCTNSFRHYDSGKFRNKHAAKDLAGAAAPLVRSTQPSRSDSATATASLPAFEEVDSTPQQTNGHDCGLYVCAVAEALCSVVAEELGISNKGSGGIQADFDQRERTALQQITSCSISELRQQMLKTIEQMAADKAAG